MTVQTLRAVLNTQVGCVGVEVVIYGVEFLANLIVLGSQGLDVILGMDWLARHQGLIDCANRRVTLIKRHGIPIQSSSNLSSERVLHNNSMITSDLEQVPIANEYPDVFPDVLPGMPPDRDIEFIIDLLLGMAPIYKKPYRMSTEELVKLKEQLAEQLRKGFIRPSASPWGSTVLFV